jgi:exportin-1
LYIEEKEAAEKQKAASDLEAASKIPGMLKPSQIEDKEEEI